MTENVRYQQSPIEPGGMNIAVIGSGAAGLAAAWLLCRQHNVVLLECDDRPGGHAHTARVDAVSGKLSDPGEVEEHTGRLSDHSSCSTNMVSNAIAIDTGFIVYNEVTYPNFTAWMNELGVATEPTDMSFAVSRDSGGFEYAGGTRGGLFAQPSNLLKPRYWRMLRDLVRFYKNSVAASDSSDEESLGEFLRRGGYSKSFIEDHLLPFGAAIWSTPQATMLDHPVKAFVSFCDNHGLLKLSGRPQWRTLSHGSTSYVSRVLADLPLAGVRLNFHVTSVENTHSGVCVKSDDGRVEYFDQVVVACHADQALKILDQPTKRQRELLGCFRYEKNDAVLHTDSSLMPLRRAAWASWNYVESVDSPAEAKPGVVYWMNKLQNLQCSGNFFVSLNATVAPAENTVVRTMQYEHPVFNNATSRAQRQLWDLQGSDNIWFCGSYFGAGFHEDAVQSGLAVAEQLGDCRRPWEVDNESSRIFLKPAAKSIRRDLPSATLELDQA